MSYLAQGTTDWNAMADNFGGIVTTFITGREKRKHRIQERKEFEASARVGVARAWAMAAAAGVAIVVLGRRR